MTWEKNHSSSRLQSFRKLLLVGGILTTVTTLGLVACSPPGATAAAPPTSTAVTAAQSGSPVTASSAPASGIPATLPPVATPTAIPTVPSAGNLRQYSAAQTPVAPGGWVSQEVVLDFEAPATAGESLIPQVEVVAGDHPFTGTPTTQGAPIAATAASSRATITLKDLSPDQYRWQARFADAKSGKVGPWTAFSGGAAGFRLAGPAPSVQNLTLTGASQTANGVPMVAAKDQPVLHWTLKTDQPDAVDHLIEEADHQQQAPSSPPADGSTISATSDSQPLGDLMDGSWYIRVWAVDKAGQVGAPASLPVQVLRTSPQLDNVLYRTWATNPSYQTLPISFAVSQAAQVSVFILPESSGTPLRSYSLGQQSADATVKVQWDGKDAQGHSVPPGSYRLMIDAVDAAGNQTQALYTGLSITDKVIKVTLGKEEMTAYAGSQVFATTVVTTGGQALPTRPGQFEVIQKSSPFVFHAQYPKGSPYWFPDVTSHFAMLYDQPDADFIHDAPWRSVYGPGTNGPGIPGSTYTGSHGCVETPEATMARLYDWTPLGTPVIVTQ